MKIVFMGTPDYATIILKETLKHFKVEAIFTQEDKPVGRKQIITPPHIKQYILDKKLDIPIFQPKSLKDEKIIKIIQNINPNFIIVAAYGQILPKEILNIAPCINLHASILPKYRGASPIQQAILNDDEFTGVTSMLMNEGLDSGDILGFSFVKIENKDIQELFDELSFAASKLTIQTIKNFYNIRPIKQNNCNVSYCKKIKKEDGLVDFINAKEINLKFRAFKYWPKINLKSGLKLTDIELVEANSINDSAKILEIEDDFIIHSCIKGSIKIKKVQPPSKKEMGVVDYIRGKRLNIGDCLI